MGVTVTGRQTILRNIEIAGARFHEGAIEAADAIARLLESYARSHHLYHDRTANLTNSTRAFVEEVRDDLISIVLTAGMEYAVFLELGTERMGTKYAWLAPAVEENRTRIVQILRESMGGL